MRTTTIATTSRRWIKPPAVYAVAKPSAHRTKRMTARVQSIYLSAPWLVAVKGTPVAVESSKNRPPPLHYDDDQDDDRKHRGIDADIVSAGQSHGPQDQQNGNNRPKHRL